MIEHAGEKLRLPVGEVRIGRSPSCDLILDDVMASRLHARAVVTQERVVIYDEGSANGVYVNGRRILGSEELSLGDVVEIGDAKLALSKATTGYVSKSTPPPGEFLLDEAMDTLVDLIGARQSEAAAIETKHPAPPSVPRQQAPTLPRPTSPPEVPKRRSVSPGPSVPRADPFEQQTSLPEADDAEIALALGDVAEAERILVPALARVRGHVTDEAPVAPALAERAALLAAELAVATGKQGWADYPLNLYAKMRLPIPPSVLERLRVAIRRAPAFDPEPLGRYLRALKNVSGELSAGQLADLGALEQIADALKKK